MKLDSILLFLAVASLSEPALAADPPVWNRPTSDTTVGSVAYFDCQTPATFTGTAVYMKLWVGGTAVALNHGRNRLAAAIPKPPGTYSTVCQYSIDGMSGIDSVAISTTYGNSAAARTKLENVDWSQTGGCGGTTCGPIPGATDTFDTAAADTHDGNDGSRSFEGTWSGSPAFQDEDWFKKRCEDVPLPGAWIFDFWVRQTDVPRALEWGISHVDGNNVKYRMAFQANYAASPNVWKFFTPDGADPGGSGGNWTPTALQPTTFTGVAENNGFTHVYFVGHPSTGSGGVPTATIDAIQIGEANGVKATENSATILDVEVPAYTNASNGGCASPVWNLQSTQIDLDSGHTHDKMWLDEVGLHFQP